MLDSEGQFHTYDAARFIDNNELTLYIMEKNFDGSRSDRRFVSMNYVPKFLSSAWDSGVHGAKHTLCDPRCK